ncbi:MAG: hypothetical protein A07HR60_00325, partial [uncultured archaeon A07HR60]
MSKQRPQSSDSGADGDGEFAGTKDDALPSHEVTEGPSGHHTEPCSGRWD